jgi:hypothetical protein
LLYFQLPQRVVSDLRLVVAPAFTTTDGIEILRVPPPRPPTFVPVNSFEVDGAPECPLDDVAIAATIRAALVAALPTVAVNDSTLYICARGGELMEKNTPFWWHGQPPCRYSLKGRFMGVFRDRGKTWPGSYVPNESSCRGHRLQRQLCCCQNQRACCMLLSRNIQCGFGSIIQD